MITYTFHILKTYPAVVYLRAFDEADREKVFSQEDGFKRHYDNVTKEQINKKMMQMKKCADKFLCIK